MVKQPETTKRAAVWNPPRIRKLNLRAAGSGTKQFPNDVVWEGGDGSSTTPHCTAQYRMPNSGESVDAANYWASTPAALPSE